MTVHPMLLRAAATPAEQRYLDLYGQVADKLPGSQIPSVRLSREAALDAFVLKGLPHRRIEEWKYTDLRALMPEVHPLAGLDGNAASDVDLSATLGDGLAGLDTYRAVFWNGRFLPSASTLQRAPGVTFEPMAVHYHDGSAFRDETSVEGLDAIALLARAFATDGAVIDVAPGAIVDKPVHLIFAGNAASPALFAFVSRVSLGAHSKATIIETQAYTGRAQSISSVQTGLAEHAELTHARVSPGGETKTLSSVSATLGAHAAYRPVQLDIGGALSREQGHIRFAGEGGRCQYTGAMLLRRREHADFTLVVEHDAVGCESRELVKAVLDGKSRGIFQGKVVVQRGAQKTDGKQMANALLLSDEAEFDSKPELEIYADDVTCGHGATAGQLDDDLMFYLRARGIPEKEARSLLIASFVGEALDQIEHEGLRDALRAKVDVWLHDA